MATWPYPPQEALDDVTTVAANVAQMNPSTAYAGLSGAVQRRVLRLRYGVVSADDAQGMAEFYADRRGSFEAFDVIHPLDGRVYRVRFDATMRRELFTPVYFRAGGEIVLEVLP